MKIYIVRELADPADGFESPIHGCFTNREAAEACLQSVGEDEYFPDPDLLYIEEAELQDSYNAG